MTEETTTTEETAAEATASPVTTEATAAPAAAPVAAPAPQAGPVLMERDPDKVLGMGVCKAMVPAAEVENYKAAGWTVAGD